MLLSMEINVSASAHAMGQIGVSEREDVLLLAMVLAVARGDEFFMEAVARLMHAGTFKQEGPELKRWLH